MVAELEIRRNLLASELATVPGFKPIVPKATFYMMVNVTRAMEMMKMTNLEQFRQKLLNDTGVSFCTRAHFGTPLMGESEMYVRFAFSGVTTDDIKEVGSVLRPYMEQYKK